MGIQSSLSAIKKWFSNSGATYPENRTKRKTLIGLEILEGRVVPATLLVNNLVDTTNQQTPWPDSLRAAVSLAKPGDTIEFNSSLFPDAEGPKTLVLNGAIGYLNLIQNNVSIIGPGVFQSGDYSGQYKLKLEADIGITGVQITNGGTGYKIGDIIRQGSTRDYGGAEFQVQTVGINGEITQLTINKIGANENLAINSDMNYIQTGVFNLSTYVGNGKGAELRVIDKNYDNTIIWSQQIPAANQRVTVSGIHFGNSSSTQVQQNLGDLVIADCLFNSTTTGNFINTAGGGGSLTISNSTFAGADRQVYMGGAGPTIIANSTFSLAGDFSAGDKGAAFFGGGNSVTVSGSSFIDNGSALITSAPTASITDTYFKRNSNGAITLNTTKATIQNTFFEENSRSVGIQVNPTSYGTTTLLTGPYSGQNDNNGGAAIFAWNGSSLNISKSLFVNNFIGDSSIKNSGINVFNSGGGAIYNNNGTLVIDQTGFTGNSVTISHYPYIEASDNSTDFGENPELMPSAANSGGGALYSGGPTTITNSYFNDNALYSRVDFWAYTKIPDSGTPANSMPQYAGGGALYLTSNVGATDINISNVTISNNTVAQVNSIPNKYVSAPINGLAVADFDQDGVTDMAAGTAEKVNNIQIKLGTNLFRPSFPDTFEYFSSTNPISEVAAGDFNGDSWPDLAVASGSKISIFLNKGETNGTWNGFDTLASTYSFSSTINSLKTAFLNSDSRADLIAATTNGIAVALATQTGTFPTVTRYLSGNMTAVTTGDLTADGLVDIAATAGSGFNNVRSLVNNPSNPGTFSTGQSGTAGGDPAASPPTLPPALTSIGIGDFDGNGVSDIVVSNAEATDNVFLFQSVNVASPFPTASKATAGSLTNSIAVGDFLRNGVTDFALSQTTDSDNIQIGYFDFAAGALAFKSFTAGSDPASLLSFQTTPWSNPQLLIGNPTIGQNLWYGPTVNPADATKYIATPLTQVGIISSGMGLNAGGLMIAGGVDTGVTNTVQERAFTGTTTATLTNVTISYNQLVNTGIMTGQTVANSNIRTAQVTSNGNWYNQTDTGGLFNNTGSGSSIAFLNSILMNNRGISYVEPMKSGIATVATSNGGSRYQAGGPGSFRSAGYSMYNNMYTSFPGPARGDMTTLLSPSYDGGLRNNLGPAIGLKKPVVGLTGDGQANILTLALDRYSPGRDAGNSSVYPTPLATDARNVQRLINLAVDMGAFEVQSATATTVASPILNPVTQPNYPNPYILSDFGAPFEMVAQILPNDNLTPTQAISGTVYLVSADDNNLVFASGPVSPKNPSDPSQGGLANLLINSSQRISTKLPLISPVNATFAIGPNGQLQTLIFEKNLALNPGDTIRFESVGSSPTAVQNGSVVSYDPISGLLAFQKTSSTGTGTFSLWKATLESANTFTISSSGNTESIYIATNLNNLVPNQLIRLYPLDLNGKPVNNDNNYQLATVSGYDKTTGLLTFVQTGSKGSGTFSNWSIALEAIPPLKNNYVLIYSSDPYYALSQSNTFTIDVTPASTQTTIVSQSPTGSSPTSSVTFTGTVLADPVAGSSGAVPLGPNGQIPLGTVSLQYKASSGFTWTNFAIAQAQVNGDGTFIFSNVAMPGNTPSIYQDFDIRAVYTSTDTTRFNGSASAPITQEVGYVLNSFTVSVSPTTINRGGLVNFTATAGFSDTAGHGEPPFVYNSGTNTSNVRFVAVPQGQFSPAYTYYATTKTVSGTTAQYLAPNIPSANLTVGTWQITAFYDHLNGNLIAGSYLDAQSSNIASLEVKPVATTTNISMTNTVDPRFTSVYSALPDITATVTPNFPWPHSTNPGTIAFTIQNGSQILAQATLPATSGGSEILVATWSKSAIYAALGNKYLDVLSTGSSYSVSAVYSGDMTDWDTSTSPTESLSVDQAPTSLSLASSASTIEVGRALTFTATVQNAVTITTPPAPTPTGEVEFSMVGVTWKANVVGGVAILTIPAPNFLDKTLFPNSWSSPVFTARYLGENNYKASQNTTTIHTYSSTTQIVTPLTPARYGNPQAIATEVLLHHDSQTIPPVFNPNTNGGNTSGTVGLTIGNGSGSWGPYSAPLTIRNGYPLDANGKPIPVPITPAPVPALNVGTYTVQAAYSGDFQNLNYSSSISQTASLEVIKAQTNLVMTQSTGSRVEVGQTIQLVATLTGIVDSTAVKPAGIIRFYLNNGMTNTQVGTGSIASNGEAKFSYLLTKYGNYTFTAVYDGSANYEGATSNSYQFVGYVNPATSVSLQSSTNQTDYGTPIVFTAVISNPPAGGPGYNQDGTQAPVVNFYSGTLKLNPTPVIVPLDSNGYPLPAQFVLTDANATTATNPLTVTAKFSGDTYYSPSSSTPVSVVVNKATTILTFSPAIPSPLEAGKPISLSVKLNTNAKDPAEAPTGSVTFWSTGPDNLKTNLGSGPLSPEAGSNTVFVASLPGTITLTQAGTYNLTATYGGTSNYLASSGNTQVTTYIESRTALALNITQTTPGAYGSPVTLVAIVAPISQYPLANMSGTVSFFADNQFLGSQKVILGADDRPLPVTFQTNSLNAGYTTLKAVYSNDPYFQQAETSKGINITKADTALTVGSTPSNPLAGSPITLSVNITSAVPSNLPGTTGTVDFYLGGTKVGSSIVASNKASINLKTPIQGGIYTYEARYGGNSNYRESSGSTAVNVQSLIATNTILTTDTKVLTYGSDLNLTASILPGAPPAYLGGNIQFLINGVVAGTVDISTDSQGSPLPVNFTAQKPAAGTLTIVARYSGDGSNYLGSSSNNQEVLVNKLTTTTTVSASPTIAQTGKTVTFNASISSASGLPTNGQVEFYLDGARSGSAPIVSGTATFNSSFATPGVHSFEARYNGNSNFTASAGSGSINVSQTVDQGGFMVAPQQGSFIEYFDSKNSGNIQRIQPMGLNYSGGFTLATGDVNGDGIADQIYSPRTTGQVTVLNGADLKPMGSLYPFGQQFRGSLSIAVGDVNGDGFGDIIAAPASIGYAPHVIAMSGKNFTTTLFSQYAYSVQFLGGVSVASGEVNGDGAKDIITAPMAGAPPHIVSFNAITGKVLQSYYAYDPRYMGGTSIATADLNNDGFTEIITAASAYAPHVVVVDSKLAMQYPSDPAKFVKASFYAYAPSFAGGVRVATVKDINGDGFDDVMTVPGPGAGPNTVRFNGKDLMQNNVKVIDSFFAYSPSDPSANYYGGAFVG